MNYYSFKPCLSFNATSHKLLSVKYYKLGRLLLYQLLLTVLAYIRIIFFFNINIILAIIPYILNSYINSNSVLARSLLNFIKLRLINMYYKNFKRSF